MDATTHSYDMRSVQLTAPGFLTCALALVIVRIALVTIGFLKTLRWARARSRVTVISPECAIGIAMTAAHNVSAAAAMVPGRLRCLEQSLVLYALLRRRGVPCELRLGVQPYGMVSHAWVECNNQPINESGELLRKIVPFPDVKT